jgi:DNA-binding NarL/FixJ family response regulator
VSVLVVDDQAPFRRAMRAVLDRSANFVLIGEAETGEASVEAASRSQPDLVLMDINLPGISGIEASTRIRAALPRTVVFLCSTYARADLPAGVDTSGAAAYVHKEELSAALLQQLWDEHGTQTRALE